MTRLRRPVIGYGTAAALILLLVGFGLGIFPRQESRSPAQDHSTNDPAPARRGEVVRLKATADIWLSDANQHERNTSAGKCAYFKLKTIQEMAAIRFDASAAKGREVLGATLFLRRSGRDMLRYLRVSTVNQDWVEGNGRAPYGPPDGATYLYADAATKRPWAWPGSQFCDVVMTSGNSLHAWAERKERANGWIAVPLTPDLIYAMVAGDTDGLAVMDGGNPAFCNNMIYSAQSEGSEPYIEVELGRPLAAAPPAKPMVEITPAPERTGVEPIDPTSNLGAALKIVIQPAKDVFCWRLTLNGHPVERWRIRHPERRGPTVFYLEDLPFGEEMTLDVVAVSRGGIASSPARVVVRTPPAPPPPPKLAALHAPTAHGEPPRRANKMRVWALPGLIKLSPEKPQPMYDDLGAGGDYRSANAVWDGQAIRLFGARGEYVSYQLCIERPGSDPLRDVRVLPRELKGPDGAAVTADDIELFKMWYAQNRDGRWQPAYCVPMDSDAAFEIPDPVRGLAQQQNQSVYVDVYIPKDARPGDYRGAVTVRAEGAAPVSIPVLLTVFDFALPDRLSFWPELNGYHIPANAIEYYRLAHQHRCVANYWRWAPRIEGSGRNIRVLWNEYDRDAGPLLSGTAFMNNRRRGVPVEVMYLPFEDSWPTPLSKETYYYSGYWPKQGDPEKWITEHYLTAPYIGYALSREYQEAFLSVQRQFIEHFKRRGYSQTQMQCFYGGKNTHRIQYGANMWWTTDEPYHWDDWLALQFFCWTWSRGRGDAPASQWAARADISRPQWQGRVLEHAVDVVYFGAGAATAPAMLRRCRMLARDTGLAFRTYGSANADNESNTRSVAWLVSVWLNGAGAALPWQTLGDKEALDSNDRGAGGGNALIVPGRRLGHAVLADMRLKALRDGQQLVEYLTLVADRYKLSRPQIEAVVEQVVALKGRTRSNAGLDNAEALRFTSLKGWQIAELRRRLAELIVKKP